MEAEDDSSHSEGGAHHRGFMASPASAALRAARCFVSSRSFCLFACGTREALLRGIEWVAPLADQAPHADRGRLLHPPSKYMIRQCGQLAIL